MEQYTYLHCPWKQNAKLEKYCSVKKYDYYFFPKAISPPRIRITDTSRENSPKGQFLTVGIVNLLMILDYMINSESDALPHELFTFGSLLVHC